MAYRRKMAKSKKSFYRQSKKIKRVNLAAPRGGFRL